MAAAVVALGYVVVEATSLDKWVSFASDLLGLQVASRTADQLLLRTDEKSYRLDIRRSSSVDRASVVGWEVRGPRELAELAEAVEKAGYPVTRGTAAEAAERKVIDLVKFTDPEGLSLELFYGLKKDRDRFVSPTGARFVTGDHGLGHVFQLVRDTAAYHHLYTEVLGFGLSDQVDFGPSLAGTFLHCNGRHHSFAYAPIPGVKPGVGHLMVEVDDLDLVGRAWDKVLDGAAPVASTFGKHSNDEMISFYAVTPSKFQVEYGFGGLVIDPATHRPSRLDTANFWGHKRTDPGEPDV